MMTAAFVLVLGPPHRVPAEPSVVGGVRRRLPRRHARARRRAHGRRAARDPRRARPEGRPWSRSWSELRDHGFSGRRDGGARAVGTGAPPSRRPLPPLRLARLADDLEREPELAELGGTEREVTVLFADLEGFTTFAESRPAADALAMLNAYWAAAVPRAPRRGRHDRALRRRRGDGRVQRRGRPARPRRARDARRGPACSERPRGSRRRTRAGRASVPGSRPARPRSVTSVRPSSGASRRSGTRPISPRASRRSPGRARSVLAASTARSRLGIPPRPWGRRGQGAPRAGRGVRAGRAASLAIAGVRLKSDTNQVEAWGAAEARRSAETRSAAAGFTGAPRGGAGKLVHRVRLGRSPRWTSPTTCSSRSRRSSSIAAAAGAVATWLRLPLVIAYVAVGVIVGPSAADLVEPGGELELLAQLGVALLLFVVGLKLDVHVVRRLGPVALVVGGAQVAITAAGGFLLSLALGLRTTAARTSGSASRSPARSSWSSSSRTGASSTTSTGGSRSGSSSSRTSSSWS